MFDGCFGFDTEDWYDLSSQAFRESDRSQLPSPFKANEISPLRQLATVADNVEFILPDPAHTYAIVGWGKDVCGSGLLLLHRLGIIRGRSLQASLDHGFAMFRDYCYRHGKSTSITNFTLKTLKIEKPLARLSSRET